VVALAAALFPSDAPVGTSVDDSITHQTGPKVNGAGIFRDPVRSTKRKVVYAFGLNVVVLSLRVTLPWPPQPFGLPVNLRLFRKGGPSHVQLAAEMMREIAEWLPLHRFTLAGDGASASLAKSRLPRTHVVSRLRRDAALFDLPGPRLPGQRGRPRKKGDRLPTPPELASQAATTDWTSTDVRMRGRVPCFLSAPSSGTAWLPIPPPRRSQSPRRPSALATPGLKVGPGSRVRRWPPGGAQWSVHGFALGDW